MYATHLYLFICLCLLTFEDGLSKQQLPFAESNGLKKWILDFPHETINIAGHRGRYDSKCFKNEFNRETSNWKDKWKAMYPLISAEEKLRYVTFNILILW